METEARRPVTRNYLNAFEGKVGVKYIFHEYYLPAFFFTAGFILERFMKNKQISTLFFFLILILKLTGSDNTGFTGIVTDRETKLPLVGASVYLAGTAYGTYSDDTGHFVLYGVPDGVYKLTVEMVGYERCLTEVKIDSHDKNCIRIEMEPLIYSLPPVEVYAQKERMTISNGSIIKSYFLDSLNMPTDKLVELLKVIPGITVLKNGNGRTVLLKSGSEAKHLKVTLNGVDITNPQTGEILMDVIPGDRVDIIEVINGPVSLGESGIGGTVNIITAKKSSREISVYGELADYESRGSGEGEVPLRMVRGVNDGKKTGFNGNFNWKNKILTNFSFTFTQAVNDFSYDHDGNSYVRENNGYFKRLWYAGLNWKEPLKIIKTVSFYTTYNSSYYQIPSSFYEFNPTNDAYSREEMLISAMDMESYSLKNIRLKTKLSHKYLKNIFNGEHEEPWFNSYKTKNDNVIFSFSQLLSATYLHGNYMVEGGYNYIKENLNSSDLLIPERSIGKKSRERISVVTSHNLSFDRNIRQYGITATVRGEKSFTEEWRRLFSTAAYLKYSIWKHIVRLTAQYTESLRYPDFNSLFWVPYARASGNENLKPEYGNNVTGELNIEGNGSLRYALGLKIFKNEVKDYIVWSSHLGGVWMPENLRRTEIRGYQLNIETPLGFGGLIRSDYYYQTALNLDSNDPNYYLKTLPYLFKYQWKTSINYSIADYSVSLFVQRNSERETNFYNTPTTRTSPFTVWDFKLAKKFKLLKGSMISSLEINNIFGEDYQLVIGYPMPGRNYKLKLLFKTGGKP